jgi:hypothetical protein
MLQQKGDCKIECLNSRVHNCGTALSLLLADVLNN